MSTIWISHRGLSHSHDDNTRASFNLACEAGFSWLETDLQTTKDNHIVLCHDYNLSHVSPSNGNIGEMNRSELEKICLNKGEKLLFLDEFMLAFDQQNWVFDIKPPTMMQTMAILKDILSSNRKLLDKIIFLFWSKEQQSLFLNDFPEAICFPRIDECYRAGFLTLLGLSLFGSIKQNKIYSIRPKIMGVPIMSRRIVKKFHQRGARVIGYLPETEQDARQCLDDGVDYILSNDRPL